MPDEDARDMAEEGNTLPGAGHSWRHVAAGGAGNVRLQIEAQTVAEVFTILQTCRDPMNTLRIKIMVLLIAASLIVIVLATTVTMLVRGDAPSEDHRVEVLTEQLVAVISLLEKTPGAAGAADPPSEAPPPGRLDARSTDLLKASLRRAGRDTVVTVHDQPGRFNQWVAIHLPGRLVSLPVTPIAMPSSPILPLVSWMVLVLIGMSVVAVFAANWVIRPLALLQSLVSTVDRHGVLPLIKEDGPAEVRATAAAINLLSANLRNAMESRMRLVAAAGHDFRTPMTRMRLRAEFMKDADERHQWLRDIGELDRIADSAIGLVREEVSTTRAEPIELNELLASLVEDVRDMGYAVTCHPLAVISIVAGPLALTRALRNLLINAVTHGREATVTLRTSGSTCCMLIEDCGPGIPEDLLGQVFEPFFRVNVARQQAIPGAGLGLAIAKEIIHRQGGTLEIENRDCGGLSQCVTFPAVDVLCNKTGM